MFDGSGEGNRVGPRLAARYTITYPALNKERFVTGFQPTSRFWKSAIAKLRTPSVMSPAYAVA